MARAYSVCLQKQQLTFSAAHFITFHGGVCEALHGHNFGVQCEVAGRLNDEAYVIDFLALRDDLAAIVLPWDHRVLLPTRHPRIQVETRGGEVEARFDDRRWLFPAQDICLLPVVNTTAEALAGEIGRQLLERLAVRPGGLDEIERLTVSVDENQGQWGSCTLLDRAPPLSAG